MAAFHLKKKPHRRGKKALWEETTCGRLFQVVPAQGGARRSSAVRLGDGEGRPKDSPPDLRMRRGHRITEMPGRAQAGTGKNQGLLWCCTYEVGVRSQTAGGCF